MAIWAYEALCFLTMPEGKTDIYQLVTQVALAEKQL